MTTPTPEHLTRYAALLDDFDAFAEALARPLPQTIAINPTRTSAERIRDLFAGRLELTPVAWCDGAFRLAARDRPGRLWGFSSGLYSVQEEASLLPARLLDARPGHRVLDLCAAPGNKTAHLALALGNRGTVIANDIKTPRLQALYDVCRRMGICNVSVTDHDGAVYPVADDQFDRILVDAPCTSEGKPQRGHVRAASDRFRSFVCGQQRALLKRAVDLCRPGGRIVYSTCTFAPEENEAIISDVLEAAAGRLRALPSFVHVPGASPGLTTFLGRDFHPDVAHGVRLWPHRTGTGGFFAILLERLPAGVAPDAPAPIALPPAADPSLLAAPFERFGLPEEALHDLHLFEFGRTLRVLPRDHAPPAGIRFETMGLECARLGNDGRARLATSGLLALGTGARRNVVDLHADQLEHWRQRRDLILPADKAAGIEPGPVLVRHAGFVQGGGLLRAAADGESRLESHFPKAWMPAPPLERSA